MIRARLNIGEGICMLPSDINLNIRSGTAGYNNEILVSDNGFSLRRNDMVNTSVPETTSHKTSIILKYIPMPKASCKEVLPSPQHTSAITHEEKRVTLFLVLTSAFRIWYDFR